MDFLLFFEEVSHIISFIRKSVILSQIELGCVRIVVDLISHHWLVNSIIILVKHIFVEFGQNKTIIGVDVVVSVLFSQFKGKTDFGCINVLVTDEIDWLVVGKFGFVEEDLYSVLISVEEFLLFHFHVLNRKKNSWMSKVNTHSPNRMVVHTITKVYLYFFILFPHIFNWSIHGFYLCILRVFSSFFLCIFCDYLRTSIWRFHRSSIYSFISCLSNLFVRNMVRLQSVVLQRLSFHLLVLS